jgi:hypothetical protein
MSANDKFVSRSSPHADTPTELERFDPVAPRIRHLAGRVSVMQITGGERGDTLGNICTPNRQDGTRRGTHHLMRRRSKQRQTQRPTSLCAHDDEVRRLVCRNPQDLAVGTTNHDTLLNRAQGPRFFGDQCPQSLAGIVDEIATILGHVEVSVFE